MKTLKQLIEDQKFDYVYPPILEQVDNVAVPEKLRTDYKVFKFGKYIETEEVLTKMKKTGYEPALPHEFLTWVNTEWNGKDWVVAPSSVFADEGGSRCFLYVARDGGRRKLGLTDVGREWSDRYAFLAVKSLDTQSLGSSSGTLTLEKAIELVKKEGYRIIKEI